MAKVKVVNRQVIDGKERKRGEVIEVSAGRARDLVNDGKVQLVRAADKAAAKPGGAPKPAQVKGAKNG